VPEIMTAALIADALRTGRAVTAFDVITLEHAEAIAQAADKTSQPVILQVNRSTVSHHGGALLPLAAALSAIAAAATVPVALHLDSVDGGDLMRHGAAVGFSSMGIDVGRLPYEERVTKVSAAARWLSANEVFVEAGLGSGLDLHASHPDGPAARATVQLLTDFVARTTIDALAVTVTDVARRTSGVAPDLNVIHSLHEHVSVPLVLQLAAPMTNRDLQRSVRAGIVKVNVGSALDSTYRSALRHSLRSHATVDPRPYLAEVRTALRERATGIIEAISLP
jgi:fructose-bisphosphate aldolase, class II